MDFLRNGPSPGAPLPPKRGVSPAPRVARGASKPRPTPLDPALVPSLNPPSPRESASRPASRQAPMAPRIPSEARPRSSSRPRSASTAAEGCPSQLAAGIAAPAAEPRRAEVAAVQQAQFDITLEGIGSATDMQRPDVVSHVSTSEAFSVQRADSTKGGGDSNASTGVPGSVPATTLGGAPSGLMNFVPSNAATPPPADVPAADPAAKAADAPANSLGGPSSPVVPMTIPTFATLIGQPAVVPGAAPNSPDLELGGVTSGVFGGADSNTPTKPFAQAPGFAAGAPADAIASAPFPAFFNAATAATGPLVAAPTDGYGGVQNMMLGGAPMANFPAQSTHVSAAPTDGHGGVQTMMHTGAPMPTPAPAPAAVFSHVPVSLSTVAPTSMVPGAGPSGVPSTTLVNGPAGMAFGQAACAPGDAAFGGPAFFSISSPSAALSGMGSYAPAKESACLAAQPLATHLPGVAHASVPLSSASGNVASPMPVLVAAAALAPTQDMPHGVASMGTNNAPAPLQGSNPAAALAHTFEMPHVSVPVGSVSHCLPPPLPAPAPASVLAAAPASMCPPPTQLLTQTAAGTPGVITNAYPAPAHMHAGQPPSDAQPASRPSLDLDAWRGDVSNLHGTIDRAVQSFIAGQTRQLDAVASELASQRERFLLKEQRFVELSDSIATFVEEEAGRLEALSVPLDAEADARAEAYDAELPGPPALHRINRLWRRATSAFAALREGKDREAAQALEEQRLRLEAQAAEAQQRWEAARLAHEAEAVELRSHNTALHGQSSQRGDEVGQLHAELKRLRDGLAAAQAEIARMVQRSADLESAGSRSAYEWEAEREELVGARESQLKQVEDLNRVVAESNQRERDLEAKCVEKNGKLEQMKKVMEDQERELSEKIEKVQQYVKERQASALNAETKQKDAERLAERWQGEVRRLQSEKDRLASVVLDQENRSSSQGQDVQSVIEKHREEVAGLREAVRKAEEGGRQANQEGIQQREQEYVAKLAHERQKEKERSIALLKKKEQEVHIKDQQLKASKQRIQELEAAAQAIGAAMSGGMSSVNSKHSTSRRALSADHLPPLPMSAR